MAVDPIQMIQALYEEGQYEKALEQARRFEPHLKSHVLFHVIRARCQAQLGLTEEAVTSMQAALSLEPSNASLYCDLSQLLYNLDDTQAAAKMMERARRLDPEDPDILERWSLIQLTLGEFQKAQEGLGALVQTRRARASTYCWLAEVHALQGEILLAVEYFRRALQKEKYNFRAMTGLARGLEELGEYSEAATVLEILAHREEEPKKLCQYLFRLGLARLRSGNRIAAKKALLHCIGVDSEQVEVHRWLGRLYLDEGEFQKAREHFEAARAQEDDASLLMDLAETSLRMGEYSRAEQLLMQARAMTDDSSDQALISEKLCLLHHATQRTRLARAFALEGFSLGLRDKDTLLILLESSSLMEELEKDLEFLRKLCSGWSGFWEGIYLHFAAHQDHERALHEALSALILHPQNATLHYFAASSFAVLGQIHESLAHLREAVGRDSRWRAHARRNPCLRNLRAEPAFLDLIDEGVPIT